MSEYTNNLAVFRLNNLAVFRLKQHLLMFNNEKHKHSPPLAGPARVESQLEDLPDFPYDPPAESKYDGDVSQMVEEHDIAISLLSDDELVSPIEPLEEIDGPPLPPLYADPAAAPTLGASRMTLASMGGPAHDAPMSWRLWVVLFRMMASLIPRRGL